HVLGLAGAISVALQKPMSQLTFEPYARSKPDELKMTIIHQSEVIEKGVTFVEPKHEWDGNDLLLEVGTFADGSRAKIALATKNSAWPMFAVGGQGSGKSSSINVMLISALATGVATVWYMDGQDGASSPGLAETADWASLSEDEHERMLCALEGVIALRGL